MPRGSLAAETRVASDSISGVFVRKSPDLRAFALPEDAVIKVLDQAGQPLAATNSGIDLGPPSASIRNVGSLSVATQPVTAPDSPACLRPVRAPV